MSKENIPKAVWSGEFVVFGVQLKCHTLDNGQRIIESDSLARLFDEMENPNCTGDASDFTALSRWQRGL